MDYAHFFGPFTCWIWQHIIYAFWFFDIVINSSVFTCPIWSFELFGTCRTIWGMFASTAQLIIWVRSYLFVLELSGLWIQVFFRACLWVILNGLNFFFVVIFEITISYVFNRFIFYFTFKLNFSMIENWLGHLQTFSS